MRRPSVLGTSSRPDIFSGVAALEAIGEAAAACTSDARISPPGPEPRTAAISTPNSFASRRALGEILALEATEDPDTLAAVGAACNSVFCELARAAGAA